MICGNCHQSFRYGRNDVKWDYNGWTDTKYVICPNCKKIVIVGYKEQPDREGWYYEYNRRHVNE